MSAHSLSLLSQALQLKRIDRASAAHLRNGGGAEVLLAFDRTYDQ